MALVLDTTTGIVFLKGGFSFTSVGTVTRDGIAVTSTDGLVLQNTTASTAGVPVQQSPRLRLRSNVWNTTIVAANNTDDFWFESVPVSGATPSGLLKIGSSLNGAATTYPMQLQSSGYVNFNGNVSGTSTFFAAGNNAVNLGNETTGQLVRASALGDFNPVLSATQDIGTTVAFRTLNVLNYNRNAVVTISGTAPTIASGFGTTPSVVASNGTAAFSVNVGTGGIATGGVLTMPASTTDWASLSVKNLTALAANRADQHTVITASTTTSLTVQNQTISTGAALAWTASDVLHFGGMGK